MAAIQTSPNFGRFVELKPGLYFDFFLARGINEAYRLEFIRCVKAIYAATGSFPVKDAAVGVYQGRPVEMQVFGYIIFDDAVLVNIACSEIEVQQ